MATVNKDFKIKSGLIVEGTTATVNGNQVLTENAGDQYILNLIGGETLVKSVSAEFDVSVAGELSIDRATVDAYYDAAGDATAAQAAAEAFATAADTALYGTVTTDIATAKNAAEATAQGYANTAESDAIAAAALDATSKANAAESNAIAAAALDATSKANAAQAAAELTASDANSSLYTTVTSDISNAKSEAIAAAELHTDNAVAALVDSAPALLDTLNELAAAIGDDANFAANLATSVGEKVAKAGDTMTGALTLSGAPTENLHAATKSYVDSAEADAVSTAAADATAKANAAQAAAEATASADATAKANAAEANAIAHADGLTTDDVAEGYSSLYFTDSRARGSAGDLLAGATKSNIDITYVDGVLSITAENGVAQSTTDDLTEGTANLYFSNARAIAAIAGENIAPNTVTIDTYRKEEATQQSVASASTVVVHGMAYPYESVKYLVRVVGWDGGVKHSQITEILMTVDGNDNVALSEYGMVHTSTNPLATFSAVWNAAAGQFQLTATTAVSGCEIIAAATMLSWAD